MAEQPLRSWLLFQFLNLYIFGGTPWTCDQPVARPLLHTEQDKHRINAHRQPCLCWDSNPQSQCSSRWRLSMPLTARPLWSMAYRHLGACRSNYIPSYLILLHTASWPNRLILVTYESTVYATFLRRDCTLNDVIMCLYKEKVKS
jgi:hypothetical protein